MKKQTRIYISGQITGNPNYRREFEAGEIMASSEYPDAVILNPAKILPDGLSYGEYMRIDCLLVEMADIVFMLPDWRKSAGAVAERSLARALGKGIVEVHGLDLIKILCDQL